MSSLGRDEETLDGTMEKAVSSILQTFMIHEQCGRGNGTKEEGARCDERRTRRLDATRMVFA
jgi:hypothetical protein